MHDVTKLSDVRPGIMVRIKNDREQVIEAVVYKVI